MSGEAFKARNLCTQYPCSMSIHNTHCKPGQVEPAYIECGNGAAAMQVSQVNLFETCHSVTFYFMNKESKRYCDTTMPESIHTKDKSKRGSAFAFIFGVN